MASPANAVPTESGRAYLWPPTGEEFISITTVNKNGVPMNFLSTWAAKRTAEAAIQHLDIVIALRERSRGV